MKHLLMAAAVVCSCAAGPAVGQRFLGLQGLLTSDLYDGPGVNNGTTYPISSTYSFGLSFDGLLAAQGVASETSPAAFYTTSPINSVYNSGRFVGTVTTTQVSLLEYRLSGFSTNIDNGTAETFSADLKLLQPVQAVAGLLFVAPGSTFTFGVRNNEYSGTISIASTAVPEPATWATMIAGIGVAGVALRRRPRPKLKLA